jgi:hypothetical protein
MPFFYTNGLFLTGFFFCCIKKNLNYFPARESRLGNIFAKVTKKNKQMQIHVEIEKKKKRVGNYN